MTAEIRRIVTGHDAGGRAIVVEDGPNPHVWTAPDGGPVFELWQHAGVPDNSGDYVDPVPASAALHPPAGGAVFRVVDFPPKGDDEQIYLHRTASLDYCCVLQGSISAVLDHGEERVMRTGDVLVQRGTNHGWRNRSGEVCRVLFVLIDAEPLDPVPVDGSGE